MNAVTSLLLLLFVLWWAVPAAFGQPPEPPEGFVPIDQVPPQDQLPAAPLLIAAYVFVLAALFAYVVSVARRLSAVQRDLERLESHVKRSTRT